MMLRLLELALGWLELEQSLILVPSFNLSRVFFIGFVFDCGLVACLELGHLMLPLLPFFIFPIQNTLYQSLGRKNAQYVEETYIA